MLKAGMNWTLWKARPPSHNSLNQRELTGSTPTELIGGKEEAGVEVGDGFAKGFLDALAVTPPMVGFVLNVRERNDTDFHSRSKRFLMQQAAAPRVRAERDDIKGSELNVIRLAPLAQGQCGTVGAVRSTNPRWNHANSVRRNTRFPKMPMCDRGVGVRDVAGIPSHVGRATGRINHRVVPAIPNEVRHAVLGHPAFDDKRPGADRSVESEKSMSVADGNGGSTRHDQDQQQPRTPGERPAFFPAKQAEEGATGRVESWELRDDRRGQKAEGSN